MSRGMILITAPVFGDLTPSIAKQLPEVVRMARGATVFRKRIERIFRRCWNLVTPSPVVQGHLLGTNAVGIAWW
jgi:hypothetical protein